MKVYGIPNCDTVKKATTWLKENNIAYEFHDFKKLGISTEKVLDWCAKAGRETVLNKKGTTWKKLDAAVQASVVDDASTAALLVENTSAIKRPVVENGARLLIGFNEAMYAEAFK